MKYLLGLTILALGWGALIANDETPYCDITVNSNGTWTGNSNDCAFPEWGTFHNDGTWEAPQN